MKKSSILILFCLVGAYRMDAQTEKLPEGPLLARAPLLSKWVVTMKPMNSKPSANGKTDEMKSVTTKTESIYLQEFTDTFKKKWITWVKGPMTATISPDNGGIILGNAMDPLLCPDYAKADFQGLDWVSSNNFVKVADYKGRKCLMFSATVDVPAVEVSVPQTVDALTGKAPPVGSPSLPLDRIKVITKKIVAVPAQKNVRSAAIDFDSRLPVYAISGQMGYTFEFATPPQALLQLPPAIAKIAAAQAKPR